MFSREGYEAYLKSKGTTPKRESANGILNTHPKVRSAQKKYKEHFTIDLNAAKKAGFKEREKVKVKVKGNTDT